MTLAVVKQNALAVVASRTKFLPKLYSTRLNTILILYFYWILYKQILSEYARLIRANQYSEEDRAWQNVIETLWLCRITATSKRARNKKALLFSSLII